MYGDNFWFHIPDNPLSNTWGIYISSIAEVEQHFQSAEQKSSNNHCTLSRWTDLGQQRRWLEFSGLYVAPSPDLRHGLSSNDRPRRMSFVWEPLPKFPFLNRFWLFRLFIGKSEKSNRCTRVLSMWSCQNQKHNKCTATTLQFALTLLYVFSDHQMSITWLIVLPNYFYSKAAKQTEKSKQDWLQLLLRAWFWKVSATSYSPPVAFVRFHIPPTLSSQSAALTMATMDPEEQSLITKRKTFEADESLKRDHAEGVTIHSIPAAVFIVRDQFIATVCSGCLKTDKAQSKSRLQQCSKCKFLRYCSRECQVYVRIGLYQLRILHIQVWYALFTRRLKTGKDVTEMNAR